MMDLGCCKGPYSLWMPLLEKQPCCRELMRLPESLTLCMILP